MATSILQGNVLVSTATFETEATGAPVDPGTVTFSYRVGPTLTVLTYSGSSTPAVGTVFRTAAGVYVAWVDCTNINVNIPWRWDSTGAGQASDKGVQDITPNNI
jgi:hypothetical protein